MALQALQSPIEVGVALQLRVSLPLQLLKLPLPALPTPLGGLVVQVAHPAIAQVLDVLVGQVARRVRRGLVPAGQQLSMVDAGRDGAGAQGQGGTTAFAALGGGGGGLLLLMVCRPEQ